MYSKEEIANILNTSDAQQDSELLSIAEDKLVFFNNLIENAPSEYLRKIHKKNIDEIKQVIKQLSEADKAKVHKSSSLNDDKKVKNNSYVETNQALALLVRHNENISSKSFELFQGDNFIARSSQNFEHEVLIENDLFVSRIHAVLKINNHSATISDAGINGFKESKNGVFINGYAKRIVKEYPLNEGDTIQIGNTKLVFKWINNHKRFDIEQEVNKTEYINTVIINLL